MARKTRRGQKQCPNCKAWVKGTRAKRCPKCSYEFANGQPAVPVVETASASVAETTTKAANAITLEQIKTVGQMVRTIGGFRRLHEMLGIIKEVGGLRKFKDLLEAMEITDPGDTTS